MPDIFGEKLRGSELAFTLVVVAGFAVLFSSYGYPIYAPESLWLIVLGAIYLGLGLYGSRVLRAEEGKQLILVWIYLLSEIALGTYIIYTSKAGAWLIVLPLAGTAVEYLARPWAVTACALIWLGQIVPLYILEGPTALVGWGLAMLSAIVFVAVFIQIAVNEQKISRELTLANQKLREYAAQAEELAVVQERNRLAREIHDGLGHYLTSINIQLKAAQAISEQDPTLARETLANAQTLTQEALADVRRSISTLRADPSTNQPLPETFTRLLAEIRAAGLQADFSVAGAVRILPAQVEFTLYRTVQEGLTNIRKHAQASQVTLTLAYFTHAVQLTLADDGIGSPDPSGGFGLVGLRERIQLVGGTLQVTTTPGAGFKLEVQIPA